MATKFWTKERETEAKRLGDAFWTPENTQLYRQAMNFTMGSLTGRIPYPNALPKIRYRDLTPNDIIYYRSKYKRAQYGGKPKYEYYQRHIVSVQRLSSRNRVLITFRALGNSDTTKEHEFIVHGKNSTRLLGRNKEKDTG